MSLDRIENGGAYTAENVRLLTYQANMARSKYSDEELLSFAHAVIATSLGVTEEYLFQFLEPLFGTMLAQAFMAEAEEKGLIQPKQTKH
jgi:hypothetical protein